MDSGQRAAGVRGADGAEECAHADAAARRRAAVTSLGRKCPWGHCDNHSVVLAGPGAVDPYGVGAGHRVPREQEQELRRRLTADSP